VLTGSREMLGPVGSNVSIRLKGCDNAERVVSVRREAAFWPPQRPTFRWSTLNAGEGRRIGYLRVDAFEDDGAQLADRAMADLRDTDGLIVDIRYNSGGAASALRLASYFTEGAQPGLILLTRPWLRANGTPTKERALSAPRVDRAYTTDAVFQALSANNGAVALWTEDLGDRRYAKPVIVLQGEGTGGGAEGFAWLMRLKTKATLMGRKTSGALLGSQTFPIGEGWSVTLPVHGVWAADGANYGDRPVPPQMVVAMSRTAMCAGRDGDLEAAMMRLTGVSPPAS